MGPPSEHDRECMYLTSFSLVGHLGSHLDACLGIQELIIAYAGTFRDPSTAHESS